MLKRHRARSIIPFLFCLISIANAMRMPGFDDIRAILFLSIFVAGLCGGVGMALLILDLRSKPTEGANPTT